GGAARAGGGEAPRYAPSVDTGAAGRRGHLSRPGLRDRRRPRGRDDPLQLRRPRLPPLASRAVAAGIALPDRRHDSPDGDVTGPDPQDGDPAAADLHDLYRARLPARHDRRDALPDLPPVRGPRDRQGDHDGGPQGDAALRDATAVRPGTRGALPNALLPLHGALD